MNGALTLYLFGAPRARKLTVADTDWLYSFDEDLAKRLENMLQKNAELDVKDAGLSALSCFIGC